MASKVRLPVPSQGTTQSFLFLTSTLLHTRVKSVFLPSCQLQKPTSMAAFSKTGGYFPTGGAAKPGHMDKMAVMAANLKQILSCLLIVRPRRQNLLCRYNCSKFGIFKRRNSYINCHRVRDNSPIDCRSLPDRNKTMAVQVNISKNLIDHITRSFHLR